VAEEERTLSLVIPAGCKQGLTLVHFPAQPELFLTQNTPYIPPNTL